MSNLTIEPHERSIIIHVGGKVQGVGFRFITYQYAQSLNLVGYIKNLINGEVEILTCGTNRNINQLIDWLQQGGPTSAHITYCDINDIETQEIFASFNVRY